MKYSMCCGDCEKMFDEDDERHYLITLLAEVEWHLTLRKEVVENDWISNWIDNIIDMISQTRLLILNRKIKEPTNEQ